jgi:endo-1,4-beta-xylanase
MTHQISLRSTLTRVAGGLILLGLTACSSSSDNLDGTAPDAQSRSIPSSDLRIAADQAGFYWGAAATARDGALGLPEYDQALAGNFNMMTAENELKLPSLLSKDGVYNFGPADRLADFARAQGMKLRGHVLIWREDPSEWLGPNPTREEAIAFMRSHIHTVLGHYRDKYPDVFVHWDVVNEAFRSDGTLRDSGWHKIIGDDFIELAFVFAHQAWPELELYYNDFFEQNAVAFGVIDASGRPDPDSIRPGLGAFGPLSLCEQSLKCMAVQNMARDFVERGIPIHGIGFQGHIANLVAPDYASFAGWTHDLGIRWAVTELDNPCLGTPLGSATNGIACLDNQARIFAQVVKACVDSPACDTVVQWGVADHYSWWPGLTGGALDQPLALDSNFQLKPAGHSVLETLRQAKN